MAAFLSVDDQAVLRLIVFYVPIDVDDTLGLLEQIPDLPRQCDPSFHARAVHFGDQGFEHRRAGRHFGDFDSRSITLGDGLNSQAHLLGDLVALQVARALRQQIHLNIRHVRSAPQVVMAHQSVEIVGRRRSHIGLDVHHLALLLRFFGKQLRHARRFFERCAGGHIDDHLELALVVERQHLDLDEAEVEQRDRRPAAGPPRRRQSSSAGRPGAAGCP